jgi:hypothetical protein
LKEEALDRTVWRTRFGRGYGPVVRQTTEWRGYGPVVRQTAEWMNTCVGACVCTYIQNWAKVVDTWRLKALRLVLNDWRHDVRAVGCIYCHHN